MECSNEHTLRESNEMTGVDILKQKRDAEYKKVHRDKRAQERKLLLLKVGMPRTSVSFSSLRLERPVKHKFLKTKIF